MSRKSARMHAFKLIYQLDFSNDNIDEIFDFYSIRFKNFDEENETIIHNEFYGVAENLNYLDEIIELVAEYSHEDAILIGGNGQDVIIDIQERIKLISEKLS